MFINYVDINSRIRIDNAKSKYNIVDLTDSLGNSQVSFELRWNVVPWVGILQNHAHILLSSYKMPPSLISKYN